MYPQTTEKCTFYFLKIKFSCTHSLRCEVVENLAVNSLASRATQRELSQFLFGTLSIKTAKKNKYGLNLLTAKKIKYSL